MPLNPTLFHHLPSTEEMYRRIEIYKERNADITSYMWYLLPLVEKFGNRVYEVAAKSLSQNGLTVTVEQLTALGDELRTDEGKQKYATNRALHISTMVTSVKTKAK